jgi:hypothetical protein
MCCGSGVGQADQIDRPEWGLHAWVDQLIHRPGIRLPKITLSR